MRPEGRCLTPHGSIGDRTPPFPATRPRQPTAAPIDQSKAQRQRPRRHPPPHSGRPSPQPRDRAARLAEDGRILQAAESLDQVIDTAVQPLRVDNPHFLSVRMMRAAILFIGGDFRRALPEFTALTAAHAQLAGAADPTTVECAKQAAYCLAELGRTTDAPREFQRLHTVVRRSSSDVDENAVDPRRSIAVLLLAERQTAEAEDLLTALHEDLRMAYGQDDQDAQDVAGILSRMRLAGS